MNKQKTFTHLLKKVDSNNFHKKNSKLIDMLPDEIIDIPNIIVYGSNNIGKYCFSLLLLKKYSSTNLRYEKKVTIISQHIIHTYKISDIHIEIDFECLGCNAKILWSNIYNQVYDIACINSNKTSIILCKNFNKIHSELLENFYSYMQENFFDSIHIKFIILTNSIAFIPSNIIDISKLITLKVPNKTNLKLYNNNLKYNKNKDLSKLFTPYKLTADKLINYVRNYKTNNLSRLRELCYDLLVLQLNIQDAMMYITEQLVISNHIHKDNVNIILIKTYVCLKYFNNNYRPIYHLENYFINLIRHIYE